MKMDKLPLPSAGSKVFGLEVCNSLVLFYERSDRWQLWLVWCCVKLWDKYCGRILSQFLHNLVIANRERKRQLKNEFVLSAVHFFVFCYKTLLLGFLNHSNTTFIIILYFNQICKCYVVLNGLHGIYFLSVSLRYCFVAWKPRSVARWDRLLPQEEL